MLADPWAIALLVSGAAALLLMALATVTACRVLAGWRPDEDSARQIALEDQTVLAALLVRYALLLQIFSLVLLLGAATSFAGVLAGAMCAAGALSANSFGLPALGVKLAAVFLYGFWLVLHGLDLRSEHRPLVRPAFALLLLLLPLVATDTLLGVLYLANLQPDIVTSCCGVLFAPRSAGGFSLFDPLPGLPLPVPFLFLATLILLAAVRLRGRPPSPVLDIVLGLGCPAFFILALLVITNDISPYIYALPSHRCPFDLFDRATGYIGYPLYLSLFAATFAGASASWVAPLRGRPGLAGPVASYRHQAFNLLLTALPLFLLLCLWHPAAYVLRGGE